MKSFSIVYYPLYRRRLSVSLLSNRSSIDSSLFFFPKPITLPVSLTRVLVFLITFKIYQQHLVCLLVLIKVFCYVIIILNRNVLSCLYSIIREMKNLFFGERLHKDE